MKLWMLGLFVLLSANAVAHENQLSPEERAAGWELIFDGQTLGKWNYLEGSKTDHRWQAEGAIQNGALNPHTTTGPHAYMMIYDEPLEDFILSLDFKSEGNSGVFLRTFPLQPRPGLDVGYNAIEMAVDVTTGTGYTDPGALYDLERPTRNMFKRGAWNHLIVTNHANLITVVLNDEMVSVMNLDEFDKPGKRSDGTPHKFGADKVYKDHPRKGYIGLQDHGANVWYKNIKLLRLKRTEPK
jgi:hypothetical protein